MAGTTTITGVTNVMAYGIASPDDDYMTQQHKYTTSASSSIMSSMKLEYSPSSHSGSNTALRVNNRPFGQSNSSSNGGSSAGMDEIYLKGRSLIHISLQVNHFI